MQEGLQTNYPDLDKVSFYNLFIHFILSNQARIINFNNQFHSIQSGKGTINWNTMNIQKHTNILIAMQSFCFRI